MATPLSEVKEISEKTETCPNCGGEMKLRTRKSDGKQFWGCSNFFSTGCKGYRPYNNGNGNNSQPVQPAQKKEFKPSPYQEKIFQFVQHGKGNAVVEAVAGSGKTTTIVQALNYTDPNASVAFVAFNRHIAKELAKRAPSHVQVSTLHSLGYKNIRAAFPNVQLDEYKINKIMDRILENAPSLQYLDTVKTNSNIVIRLISLLQSTLMEAKDSDLEWLEDRYGIAVNGEAPFIHDAVKRIFEIAVEDTNTISFDDMVYFCATGIVPCQKFDFLFVDETQDLNPAQIQMVLKSIKENGRVVAVGDKYQSIYGFRAADVDAIPNLIQALEATVLPLSITYRCPKSIVAHINKQFPEIVFQASETAIEGLISNISSSKMLYDVQPGDLVLCRTNAPLVKPCFTLIREGRKAVIRGRDIGKGLQSLITKVTKKYHLTGLTELVYYMNMYSVSEIEKLLASNKGTRAATLKDQVETIEALSDGCNSIYELNSRIDTVFSDDVEGVVFSSIHKAKGDEANKVYVIKPELSPHPMAQQPWELQQEFNLIYVRDTRAKKELYFVR